MVTRGSIASRPRPKGRRIIRYDGLGPKGSQYEDRSTGLAVKALPFFRFWFSVKISTETVSH